jgi:hypothetical protein
MQDTGPAATQLAQRRNPCCKPVSAILRKAGVGDRKAVDLVSGAFRKYEALADGPDRKRSARRKSEDELRWERTCAAADLHIALRSVSAAHKNKALELAKAKSPSLKHWAWGKSIGAGIAALVAGVVAMESVKPLLEHLKSFGKSLGLPDPLSEAISGTIYFIGAVFIAYRKFSREHKHLDKFIAALEPLKG